MKDTLIHTETKGILKVECFKMNDKDELTEDAYKVVSTNTQTNESDFVTCAQPQAAIALSDYIFANP